VADEFAGITVDGGTVSHKDGSGPLAGAKATVEPVGEVGEPKRTFRLFKRKGEGGKLALTVTGDGYTFVETLDAPNGKAARKFADRINFLSSEATSNATPGSGPPTEAIPPGRGSIASELRRLAGLRDTGVLSSDDYEAEKAKLLH
jgi:hypothetical protein